MQVKKFFQEYGRVIHKDICITLLYSQMLVFKIITFPQILNMKRCYRYFVLLIITTSVVCCTSRSKDAICPIDSSNEYTTINIDSAKKVEELLCSSVLAPPRTIILETNDKCIIKDIHSIDLFEDKLYILDSSGNKLYVFSINGSFLYSIGHRGKGRGEYTEISDFCIDRENKYIYLWDPAMKTALKYDIQSRKYITSIKVDIDGYDSYSLMYYNRKLYVNRTSTEIDEENYLINEIEENSGQKIAKYLKANEYNHGWNFPLRLQRRTFMAKNSSSPKFVELFTDTIISFTENGLRPAYVIKSKNFVKDDDISSFIKTSQKSRDYNIFNLDDHLIFMPRCLFDMDNYVSFEMMSEKQLFYILFNKKTKETLKSTLFTNDYISSDCYIAANLFFCDDEGVISVLRSDFIPHFKEEVVANGLLNKDIDNYDSLIQLEETANPVLFYHKYK